MRENVSNMAGEQTLAEQKGHTRMHTYISNQCPYQVSTFYTFCNPRNNPDKILKLMVTMTMSKVKSRSHNDVARLQPLTNILIIYQLPTPNDFQNIAQTRFYRLRSLRQGQRSNQGHTMALHTYTP